jgi:GYF domain 2
MSSRSWFYASNGQQQGPVSEVQFRDLIARGIVTQQTLVWSEGMTGWQKAGDVPGLISAAMAPTMPSGGGPVSRSHGSVETLSLELGILEFVWRSIVFLIGVLFVIPAPWTIAWYTNWLVSRIQVPGRPNLSFTGSALTIALWFFGAIVVEIIFSAIAIQSGHQAIGELGGIIQLLLYWLFLKYLFANLASNGQPLGLSFSGSFWAFLGWTLLTVISFLTIIGWAWVYAAQMRWICRNIQGTRRQVVFKGSGLQLLWRVIVLALVCLLVIPIPWMYRWMLRWLLSQTELVPRT